MNLKKYICGVNTPVILVSGNGTLAKELKKLSTDNLPIYIISHDEMDIRNAKKVDRTVYKITKCISNPIYFIHTAAITKPMNMIDKNPILSIDTNIIGTANVAKVCLKYNIKFIYISTDFVYGISNNSFSESDGVYPINKYAWSKLGGECICQLIPNSLILRCAISDIPFRHRAAFSDIYKNSITHADAAKLILQLKNETGIFNIGNKYCSIYEFVSKYHPIKKSSGINISHSVQLNLTKLKNINE